MSFSLKVIENKTKIDKWNMKKLHMNKMAEPLTGQRLIILGKNCFKKSGLDTELDTTGNVSNGRFKTLFNKVSLDRLKMWVFVVAHSVLTL